VSDPRDDAAGAPPAWLESVPTSGVRMRAGHLDGLDGSGRLLFRAEGDPGPSRPVVIGLELSDGALVKAARTGRRALVLEPADGDDSDRAPAVLVGLLRERVSAEARDAAPGELEVRVEGDTLQLKADREIELRCGKSRLRLRRDGKVVLNGAHILSASTGPQRIKGATIALN
jgi:hypothetical protein